jgi:hypothetical protein
LAEPLTPNDAGGAARREFEFDDSPDEYGAGRRSDPAAVPEIHVDCPHDESGAGLSRQI